MVTKRDVLRALRESGLEAGDTVMIHTAIKAIGFIEGGAQTVVDAFLEVLGPAGTLVAPTFILYRDAAPDGGPIIIDPENDEGRMGAINEVVRCHPDAKKSVALYHPFAAIGPKAEEITSCDITTAPLATEGTFGKLYESDCKVMLMGVSYYHCTACHYAEFLCNVPYRHFEEVDVRVKQPDGTLVNAKTSLYRPNPVGYPPQNFNHAGFALEELGKVKITTLGNAMVRCFQLREFLSLITEKYAQGVNLLTYPVETGLPVDPHGGVVFVRKYQDKEGRNLSCSLNVIDPEKV